MTDPIELSYDLAMLPAGRFPFHRWRWELWNGAQLLAAGWRTAPASAQRALRLRALRHAHRVHGLHPLHLEAAHGADAAWTGNAEVVLDWGELRVVLTPRAIAAPSHPASAGLAATA